MSFIFDYTTKTSFSSSSVISHEASVLETSIFSRVFSSTLSRYFFFVFTFIHLDFHSEFIVVQIIKNKVGVVLGAKAGLILVQCCEKAKKLALHFLIFCLRSFFLGFLSRTFTIHRTAGEGGGYFFTTSTRFNFWKFVNIGNESKKSSGGGSEKNRKINKHLPLFIRH